MAQSCASGALTTMTDRANGLTEHAMRAAPPAGLVPAAPFRAFVQGFARLGFDVDALLAAAALARSSLDDADATISVAASRQFFAAAAQQGRLPNLAARLAQVTRVGDFPLLDYLIVTSDRVCDGCGQLARYLRLVGGPSLDIRDDENPVRVAFQCPDRFALEFNVVLTILHLREETDRRIEFAYASLTHRPDDADEIERLIGCGLRAEASWSGVALDTANWQLPLRRRDSVLHHLLTRHADQAIARLPGRETLTHDVRRILSSRIAGGDMRIGSVARELALSARSLQRRLAAAGSSYQSLIDAVRMYAATHYLRESPFSIAEIAFLLGYSEPAAFTRAFKRWFRGSPQAFRRSQRS